MNKDEFLRELEECLQDQVSEYEKRDTLDYYRAYFAEQSNLGFTEAQIIKNLGNPRLIARSVIDAHGLDQADHTVEEGEYYSSPEEEPENSTADIVRSQVRKVGLWVGIIGFLIVLGLIIKALFPLIAVIIIIMLITRIVQGR